MKKTLFTLTALLAGFAASADDTFTTTNSVTDEVTNAYFYGFALTLNVDGDSRLATTTTEGTGSIADYSEVALVSVSTNIRTLRNRSSITLALTDASGTVQALSTNSVTSTGDVTWTFDTTVSTSDMLYFVFVDCNNNDITVGHTLAQNEAANSTTSEMICTGASNLIEYNNQNGVDSLTMIGSNGSSTMELNDQNFAPKVSLVTKSLAVPEPATATLSLLALAGLAARRRRK